MIVYADSSVLVKRFVREVGSENVRDLLGHGREIATSALARVEIRSAVARQVREGLLDAGGAARVLDRVTRFLATVVVVEPRGRVLDLAGELVGRRPLRAYDAVHLASALRLANESQATVVFACADVALLAAASAEGLRTLPA